MILYTFLCVNLPFRSSIPPKAFPFLCFWLTVPDMSQILDGWSPSSTSVTVRWTAVPSAQHYILQVYSQTTGIMLNFTLTNTSAVVRNLQPTTNYDCYVFTANQAGLGSRSKVRTITTCEFDVSSNVEHVSKSADQQRLQVYLFAFFHFNLV